MKDNMLFGKKTNQNPQTAKQTPKKMGLPFDLNKLDTSEKAFREGMLNMLDIIAPSSFEITPNYLKVGDYYVKTLFTYTYPRYLQTNWLSPIINYDITADISMFIHPMESKEVMTNLRKKVGQLESTEIMEQEKGMVRNPELETAIADIEGLRDVLQRGEVKLFQFSLYFTIYGKSKEEINTITKQLESTLGGMLIYTKQAMLQMEQGYNSCLPLANNELDVRRNLDTGSLSTTFPFTSAELSSNEGILYGLNRHNNSLILFDRFNLENANSVVFAKAGSGKSYAIKLEALRSLMFGTDIIVIDPENEYKALCEAVGGSYLPLSLTSEKRINPFDIPHRENQEETGEEILRNAVITIKGLIALMVGGVNPEEDAILDKAIYETYALKDITIDAETHKNPPPLMSDLQNILSNMTRAESLAQRLEKYTTGTFSGLFNKPTNFDLDKGFIVFSIRDLEDQLRPIGMYMILNYIWNRIRFEMRKRIMIVDEAWVMMQHEDSAKFLYAIAKRCRKYYLGLTVITQDVEDFLDSKYGRAVISNSSMQLLLKQSTSSIKKISEIFNLTEGEKYLLLECEVGEGLFFAGLNHVAIKIIASYTEDQIITTDPRQLLEIKKAQGATPEQ
jgi:type IV secretory pathway VirB4 component